MQLALAFEICALIIWIAFTIMVLAGAFYLVRELFR